MEQAYKYIKRLLIFFLCVFLYFLSVEYLYYSINLPFIILNLTILPLLILTFSVLHSRITGEKPPHLFAFYRTENYFKKGGLRDLIRIFVTLFGFVYDTIIWTVWGIYLVFILFVDLLDLVKTLFYWIIHAILWILRQYIPFLIFLYKIFIHYIIRWCWWLYQIAYFNIRYTFNKNCYRVALWGTLQATIIIFVFYFLQTILIDIPGITFIGFIIALLPITWSFGEIATIRTQKLENEPFRTVKNKYQNGIESVRSILFYLTLFVVLILAQLGFNLLGWIPESGVVIAGFIFNINTFISLLLLFICILNILGVIIVPSYRLFTPFSELKLSHTMDLLKTIARKFLQYLVISLPQAFFAIIISIIPFLVILLAGYITYNLKNGITDLKINQLKTDQAASDNRVMAYFIGKRVEHLEYLKLFPTNIAQEMNHRKNLNTELSLAQEDLRSEQEELLKTTEEYQNRITRLQADMEQLKNLNRPEFQIEAMNTQIVQLQEKLRGNQVSKQLDIDKLQIDIDFLEMRKNQLPLLFLFVGLWLAIFGGFVLAFITAYFGNVYHQVYIFRNNNEKSEWMKIIDQIRAKDSKQPLLGSSLFIVTLVVIYVLIVNIKWVTSLFSFLSAFFVY